MSISLNIAQRVFFFVLLLCGKQIEGAISSKNPGVYTSVSDGYKATTACPSAVVLPTTSNPFGTRTLVVDSDYAVGVKKAADRIVDANLKQKASKVADIGTFVWLDSISTVSDLQKHLNEVTCDQILGIVLNMLPGKNCASERRRHPEELTLQEYNIKYVDQIVKIVKANPNVAVAVILEPETLPNIVNNSSVPACAKAKTAYENGIPYALHQLNLPNVVQYLDAGSGMLLGWTDHLVPTASFLSSILNLGGKPQNLRGIATNVASYEAWNKSPGEWTPADDLVYPNKALNEKLYVQILGKELQKVGFPAHGIVDTSRSGVQGLRSSWLDYCNVNGAGFGFRPTANTGDEMVDAFVWVKHGGMSDGTSDRNSPNYDTLCGLSDASQPSPEAGSWSQEYFEMLVINAVPTL
ncbi:1, 4-beta cellobiohydrolase [Crepidotus variabilis]|uniref:Glucanase n=1 Tax=Crepidotus variabilis TaxID=179855 RepID=A0A9P6EHQ3_9AGAR|nr:1, 4-beta cellobiohydrolase [Crepidotus variabilis]